MAVHVVGARAAFTLCLSVVALAACNATRPIDWSPDGSQLAVAYGGHLYLIAADGTGVSRVTGGSVISDGPGAADVAWAPDGRQVAFSRGDDVRVVDIATGAERRLASGAHPAWSPDGRWVAFVVDDPSGEDVDVVIADPRGSGAPRDLGRLTADAGDGVDWSPDGGRVAACSDDGLVVIDVTDNSRHVVGVPGGCTGSPDWSPDGRLVIAARGGLLVVPADLGRPTELASDAYWSAVDPSWAPDGRKIAFTGGGGAYVVDVATGAVTALGIPDGEHPVWSPDGQSLALVTWDRRAGVVHLLRDGRPAAVIAAGPELRVELAQRASRNVLALPRGISPGTTLVTFPRPLPAPLTLGEVTLAQGGNPSVVFRVPELPADRYQLYLRDDRGNAWVAELLVAGGDPTAAWIALGGWVAAIALVAAGARRSIRRRSPVFVAAGSILLGGSVLIAGLAYPALLLLGAGLGLARWREGEGAHTSRGNVLAAVGALASCGFVCLGLTLAVEPIPSREGSLGVGWSSLGLAALGLVVLAGGVAWHASHALRAGDGERLVEAPLLGTALAGIVVLTSGWAHAGAPVWPTIVVAFAVLTLIHAVRPTRRSPDRPRDVPAETPPTVSAAPAA